MFRLVRIVVPVLFVCALQAGHAVAQSPLAIVLFERYAEALRIQAGIPGISSAIVQNGTIVWGQGFGLANIEHGIQARADTPYQISGLTEVLTTALILGECEETGHLSIRDTIVQRAISAADPVITIRDALLNRAADGTFNYDSNRFAALTGVAEACIEKDPMPFRQAIGQEIFDRWAMTDSVPAANVDDASADDPAQFSDTQLARYRGDLARMATPYHVSNGRVSVVTDVPPDVNAASGAISSALDLARFAAALDTGEVLRRATMADMWTPGITFAGTPLPTGLGWFIQTYNGQSIYWQFGAMNGYSSLLIKVPTERITLILLANSDGLTAPYALQNGDVTTSLFARTFLKLFVGG